MNDVPTELAASPPSSIISGPRISNTTQPISAPLNAFSPKGPRPEPESPDGNCRGRPMPQTMTDPVLMPPGAAEAAFGPVAAGLGPARRGGTAPRQGRAGGDGDALAVMEQLERLSVDELVGRGVGAHVDAQPPVAVEESEGEPGQSRPESRGERQRITARWHHDVPVRPGRRPHPDGEDPRPPRLHAGQRVLEDGRLGRLGAEHPRAGEEGVGRRLAGEVLALGDDAVDARLEEVVIPA